MKRAREEAADDEGIAEEQVEAKHPRQLQEGCRAASSPAPGAAAAHTNPQPATCRVLVNPH